MSEHNERLVDIVAEMRYSIIPKHRIDHELLALYAYRIEAAARRERAEIEANALAVGGVVEASRNKPSGDAAAMREALGAVAELFWEIQGLGRSPISNKAYAVKRKVIAALAKPPRNCDRFADELDAQIAFLNEVWLISVTKESLLEHDKFENWTDEMKARYAAWLLAPATAKEGETDGSK